MTDNYTRRRDGQAEARQRKSATDSGFGAWRRTAGLHPNMVPSVSRYRSPL